MKKVTPDDAFLDELLNLFLNEGFSKLTVGEIAARLRCSRRRLYQVAQTKEELFCVVVQRFFSDVLDESQMAGDGEPDLTKVLHEYLNVGVRAGSRMSATFLRDLEALEKGRSLFDQYQEARAVRMCQLLEDGVAQGVFVPCHAMVVTQFIKGAAMYIRQPDFLASAGMSMDEAFAEFYRVLMGGLLGNNRGTDLPGSEQGTRNPRAAVSRKIGRSTK